MPDLKINELLLWCLDNEIDISIRTSGLNHYREREYIIKLSNVFCEPSRHIVYTDIDIKRLLMTIGFKLERIYSDLKMKPIRKDETEENGKANL
jgi:hypothetical protein